MSHIISTPITNSPVPSKPYSLSQITVYLAHLSFPSPSTPPSPSLPFLTQLLIRQLATSPFENTKLHYTTTPLTPLAPFTQLRAPTLDPTALYTNIVERGRGGYCFELNAFFGHVLRTLGFVVRSRAGGVHANVDAETRGDVGGDWFGGWSHMVNVVSLPGGGEEWLVDVGFGGHGPVRPLPVDREEVVGGAGQKVWRVRKYGLEGREDAEDAEQREEMRVLETTLEGREESWKPLYAFGRNLAFKTRDYEILNWAVATHPGSWFTEKMVCIKFVREEEELIGAMILDGNTFTRRVGAHKEVLKECHTETERVEGLIKWFGMKFSDEEVEGIRGLPSALAL